MKEPFQKNRADTKTNFARAARQASACPVISMISPLAELPGWTLWQVGGRGGPAVAMPTLRSGAPASAQRRYRDRILTNATGRCPRCGATVDVLAAHDGQVAHEPDCPISGDAGLSQWIEAP